MRAACDWKHANPGDSYQDVAARFGVNCGSLRTQVSIDNRKAKGTSGQKKRAREAAVVAAKSQRLSPGRPPSAPVIVPLPPPPPPPPPKIQADEELSGLVKHAMAQRLRHLGDPEVIKKEGPEDFRQNTLLLLERFELVKAVQSGKPARKAAAVDSYTAALLGELPESSDSEQEETPSQAQG